MDGTLIDTTMPVRRLGQWWERNLAMNLIFKLCITSAGGDGSELSRGNDESGEYAIG